MTSLKYVKTPTGLRSQTLILIAIILAVLGGSGCSLRRLAIKNAEVVALHSINGYVDLNSDQEKFAKPAVKEHVKWIKETQFPIAQRALLEAENRISGNVTETDLAHLFGVFYTIREAVSTRLAADGAKLVTSFTPAQLDELQNKFNLSNQDMEIRLTLKDYKLIEIQKEKTFGFIEEFVGDLTDEQKVSIVAIYPPSRESLESALAARKRNQARIMALLKSGKSQPELEAIFKSWAKDTYLIREEPKEKWEERELKRRQNVAAVIKLLNEKQIGHLKKELAEIAKDLRI